VAAAVVMTFFPLAAARVAGARAVWSTLKRLLLVHSLKLLLLVLVVLLQL